VKITASFEEGSLHVLLHPENAAEQRMLGAVLDQPQAEQGCAYLDKSLVAASLSYDGHWTNKCISRVMLSIYQPNKDKP
jgi:hypothetical protein